MIDITKFLIVSIQNFDNLILNLNLNLTSSDPQYLLTYLFVNYMIFSKKGGMI